MIRREPAERFQSADEALAALRRLPPSHTTSSPSLEETLDQPGRSATTLPLQPKALSDEPRPRPSRSELRLVALAVTATGATIILVLGLLSLLSEDDPRPPPTQVAAAPSVANTPEPAVDRQPVVGAFQGVDAAGIVVKTSRFVAEESRTGCLTAPRDHVQRRFDHVQAAWEWTVELPVGYDGTQKLPALVLFHDFLVNRRSATEFLRHTGFREVQDDEPMIFIALKSASADAWSDESNELRYIHHVLEHTSDEFCIDEERIYAVGHGTGARFLERTRCDYPFAAIATTSWRNTGGHGLCGVGRMVPHIHLVGEKDGRNPIGGARHNCLGQLRISLAEKEAMWRRLNGCDDAELPYDSGPEFQCKTWACDAAFVSCTHPYGNRWPRDTDDKFIIPGLDRCNGPRIAAPLAREIWDFFEREGISPKQQAQRPIE